MRILITALSCLSLATSAFAEGGALSPQAPVEITGTHGKFDFLKVDVARRRLLACHTGNGTLDVIDLDSSKLIASVPTGAAQGVAIDDKGGRYFVSVSKPPQLAIVDASTLKVTGTVPLPEAADLAAFSDGLDRVIVDDGEKPQMWVIDPESKKVVTTIALPGTGMEDLDFDSGGLILAQNLKDSSQLAGVDTASGKVKNTWPTAPAEKPHGLARVNGTDTFLVAGGNGQLVQIDLISGQVLASADIAPHVDEIAYDGALGLVYCASGTGVMSVVSFATMKNTGDLPTAPGAHSIAVDPKTHTVWIAFTKGDKAYVQVFSH
ncbi:MAG: hypothetical protein WDO13_00125 [Verrucomicrobiota bacterium]